MSNILDKIIADKKNIVENYNLYAYKWFKNLSDHNPLVKTIKFNI